MHVAALALVLVAAGAHAGWNLLAKRTGGGASFVWCYCVAGVVLWAPLGLGALALGARHGDARRTVLGVGLLGPLAYVLVLLALRLAPVSVVAPAREVSIVLGAALGARLLGEPAGARRVAAAVAVLAGIALLAVPER